MTVCHRTTYAKVAGKYQDVLTLEQSVAELHQMFLDFALLTEQQGELLDQIEFSVKNAADHVEDANVDVYEAIEYQKKVRKKQWYVLHRWKLVDSFLFTCLLEWISLVTSVFIVQLDHSYCCCHNDCYTVCDPHSAVEGYRVNRTVRLILVICLQIVHHKEYFVS